MMFKSARKIIVVFIPLFITTATLFAQLKNSNNQADYIVIYHPQFGTEIQDFVQWRQSKGLHVLAANVQDVYKEFKGSMTQQEAIREFISYALTYWNKPSPTHVLLVGDVEFIPTNMIVTDFAGKPDTAAIDEWFTINKYESDLLPDIAIGRIPVETENELRIIIDKTKMFEDNFRLPDYTYDQVCLADSADGGLFEYASDNFLSHTLPTFYRSKKIQMRQDSPYFGSRLDLFNSLNQSTVFFTYYGHGNPTVWSKERFITAGAIDSNQWTGKPFFLSAVSCSQGFAIPNQKSIVEKLLFIPNSGAFATFSSTGLFYFQDGDYMITKMLQNVLGKSNQTIGSAILTLKRSLNSYTDTSDERRRFTLLGDPYLRIPIPLLAEIYNENLLPTEIEIHNYPNPFTTQTVFSFSLPAAEFVELSVYDYLGRKIETLLSENISAGNYRIPWNKSDLISGAYFYQLHAGKNVVKGKMIVMK